MLPEIRNHLSAIAKLIANSPATDRLPSLRAIWKDTLDSVSPENVEEVVLSEIEDFLDCTDYQNELRDLVLEALAQNDTEPQKQTNSPNNATLSVVLPMRVKQQLDRLFTKHQNGEVMLQNSEWLDQDDMLLDLLTDALELWESQDDSEVQKHIDDELRDKVRTVLEEGFTMQRDIAIVVSKVLDRILSDDTFEWADDEGLRNLVWQVYDALVRENAFAAV